MSRQFRLLLGVCAFGVGLSAASSPIVATPPSIGFGKQFLNKEYAGFTLTLKNTSAVNISVSSFSITGPFQWSSGLAPQRIGPGQSASYSLRFVPTGVG